MSRQSVLQPPNLSLTEELERLEQSITLVLQEIDHNFSRAHRIVSGSIIPIVEQYAKHSDSVWEGSKFWKQFFEASANVSLSSYEEVPEDDLTVTDHSQTEHGDATPSTRAEQGDDTVTVSGQQSSQFDNDPEDSSIRDSPFLSNAQHGTPGDKQTTHRSEGATFADYSSPYESLKEDMDNNGKQAKTNRAAAPSTPGRRSADAGPHPRDQSSPPIPMSAAQQQHLRQQNNDPLLHRVLDKNYRIGTTPHTTRKKPVSTASQAPHRNTAALDSSPFSPALAAPELRSEIFGSPARAATTGPRTPGVSVQKSKGKGHLPNPSARKTLFTSQQQRQQQQQQQQPQQRTPADPSTWNDKLWDSESDTADDLGMSPPKTMQFHVPQSRLMQTPAKEASRRIVEDLLSTAGAGSATSTLDDFDVDFGGGGVGDGEEDSPSIVRMARRDQDEEDF